MICREYKKINELFNQVNDVAVEMCRGRACGGRAGTEARQLESPGSSGWGRAGARGGSSAGTNGTRCSCEVPHDLLLPRDGVLAAPGASRWHRHGVMGAARHPWVLQRDQSGVARGAGGGSVAGAQSWGQQGKKPTALPSLLPPPPGEQTEKAAPLAAGPAGLQIWAASCFFRVNSLFSSCPSS